MALTVIFALAGSLLLSLTLMPVLAAMGLSQPAQEKEVWLLRWVKRVYQPVLDAFIRHPLAAVSWRCTGGRKRAGRAQSGWRVHAPVERRRPLDRGGPHSVGLARRGRGGFDPDRKPARRPYPRSAWSIARPAARKSPTT